VGETTSASAVVAEIDLARVLSGEERKPIDELVEGEVKSDR
jgi:hypothetical protein